MELNGKAPLWLQKGQDFTRRSHFLGGVSFWSKAPGMYPPSLQDLGIHGLHKLPRIKGRSFLERGFSLLCTKPITEPFPSNQGMGNTCLWFNRERYLVLHPWISCGISVQVWWVGTCIQHVNLLLISRGYAWHVKLLVRQCLASALAVLSLWACISPLWPEFSHLGSRTVFVKLLYTYWEFPG